MPEILFIEPDKIQEHLKQAIENLRSCRSLIKDKECLELLYHSAMTARTIQDIIKVYSSRDENTKT